MNYRLRLEPLLVAEILVLDSPLLNYDRCFFEVGGCEKHSRQLTAGDWPL